MAGIFDGFFAGTAVVVAILTAADWLIGPSLRDRLREKVGDFWTALQYRKLDDLFVSNLVPLKRLVLRIYGTAPTSLRLILASLLTNVLAIAVVLLVLFRSNLSLLASAFTDNLAAPIVSIVLVTVALTGWLPFKWLARAFDSVVKEGATWPDILSAFGRLAGRLLAFSLAYVAVLLGLFAALFGLISVISSAHAQGRDDWPDCDWTCPGGVPFGEGAAQGIAMLGQAIIVGVIATAMLGLIAALPLVAMIGLLLFIVLLKIARPMIQPVTTLLLHRLYESKQGILTQAALGLGFIAKALQEVVKYFYGAA
jgi:hypothetical protein